MLGIGYSLSTRINLNDVRIMHKGVELLAELAKGCDRSRLVNGEGGLSPFFSAILLISGYRATYCQVCSRETGRRRYDRLQGICHRFSLGSEGNIAHKSSRNSSEVGVASVFRWSSI